VIEIMTIKKSLYSKYHIKAPFPEWWAVWWDKRTSNERNKAKRTDETDNGG